MCKNLVNPRMLTFWTVTAAFLCPHHAAAGSDIQLWNTAAASRHRCDISKSGRDVCIFSVASTYRCARPLLYFMVFTLELVAAASCRGYKAAARSRGRWVTCPLVFCLKITNNSSKLSPNAPKSQFDIFITR